MPQQHGNVFVTATQSFFANPLGLIATLTESVELSAVDHRNSELAICWNVSIIPGVPGEAVLNSGVGVGAASVVVVVGGG